MTVRDKILCAGPWRVDASDVPAAAGAHAQR